MTSTEALPVIAKLIARAVVEGQHEDAEALREAAEALFFATEHPGREQRDEQREAAVRFFVDDLRVAHALRRDLLHRDALRRDPTLWQVPQDRQWH